MNIHRILKVDLSTEKRNKYVSDMSVLIDTIDSITEQKKSANSNFKAQLDEKQATLRIRNDAIRNGYEMLPVECKEENDFENGQVHIIRLDTYETVESRGLTDNERQLHLNAQKKKKDAEKKEKK